MHSACTHTHRHTHTQTHMHTCTHTFSHLDTHTHTETCKQAWRTNTHSGAEVSKTQIQISVDMEVSTHRIKTNTHTHTHTNHQPCNVILQTASCTSQVSPASSAFWPLEGSRELWLSDIYICTHTHSHTHTCMHVNTPTLGWYWEGDDIVQSSPGAVALTLCDQSQAFYALRLL